MSANRSVFQRYIDEFWNNDDLDVADELYTDDHRYHDPALPELPQGPEGVKERGRVYKAAVPGRVVEIHDWVEGGDKAACHWTYRGTHSGPMRDIPPTGRRRPSRECTSCISGTAGSPNRGSCGIA